MFIVYICGLNTQNAYSETGTAERPSYVVHARRGAQMKSKDNSFPRLMKQEEKKEKKDGRG